MSYRARRLRGCGAGEICGTEGLRAWQHCGLPKKSGYREMWAGQGATKAATKVAPFSTGQPSNPVFAGILVQPLLGVCSLAGCLLPV